MASLPSQASRRRSFPSEQASEAPSHSSSFPKDSISDSFVLNTAPVVEASSFSAIQAEEKPEMPAREVRRCWVCQEEDTEDEAWMEWRRPCPCSLTAHDHCLMEWITSEEAPKPGEIAITRHIVCPMCKAEIQIERPRDYLVLATEHIQRAGKYIIVPSAVFSIGACFYSGFLMYGFNTVQLVFGVDEANDILQSGTTQALTDQISDHGSEALNRIFSVAGRTLRMFVPFLPSGDLLAHWKLLVGLPLIAPALVLSRTRLAEPVFALVPITYILFRPSAYLHLNEWPPSSSATIAVLPYFRAFYNEIYRYTFADLEKKWDQAVQRKPREGETAEQIAEEQNDDNAHAIFDLELEFINDDEEPPPHQHNHGDNVQQGGFAHGVVEEGAALPPQNPEVNHPNPPPRAPGRENNVGVRRNISTSGVASTVMGALFFPTISSVIGELLKVTLPKDWVFKRGGLLQEKWGRSIVGGCLFVVLKDALVLYCKWKKARDFGKKRVLDYVGKRGGEAAAAAS